MVNSDVQASLQHVRLNFSLLSCPFDRALLSLWLETVGELCESCKSFPAKDKAQALILANAVRAEGIKPI